MRFTLSPPRLLTFIISLVLAVVAAILEYGHFPALRGIDGFIILMIAWLVLAAGSLLPGI
jgi:hypothetical protein